MFKTILSNLKELGSVSLSTTLKLVKVFYTLLKTAMVKAGDTFDSWLGKVTIPVA